MEGTMYAMEDFIRRAKQIPDTKDIIDDLLAEAGDIFVIGGRPGIGKSWLLRQMAFCLSTGSNFMGYAVKKCLMGIIAFEEPKHKIAEKLELAQKHFPGGRMLFQKHKPIWINYPDGKQYLLELLAGLKAEHPELKVIGLDPWKYLIKGVSKQDNILQAISNLKEIQDQLGISFVIAHHITQMDKRYRLDKPDVFSLKGFNDLAETAETVIILERGTQEQVGLDIESTRRILYLVKTRNEFVYMEKQVIFKDALLYEVPKDIYKSEQYKEFRAFVEAHPELAKKMLEGCTP